MRYTSIWTGTPGPLGHLQRRCRFQTPKYWLQHPESACWPRCGTSALQHQTLTGKVVLHTVRSAIWTTSVNCSPSAVDPSPNDSENVLKRSFAVELALGSYNVWPEQSAPHPVDGKKRSLLPVSKSTASSRGHNVTSVNRVKVIPVKCWGGVPTEMLPDHIVELKSVNASAPVLRRVGERLPQRGCGSPVFLSYAASPS